MSWKGIVKGNVVVLEENMHLPDGARVEVRVTETTISREEAFARVLAQRTANAGLHIHMEEIIEEDKQEREEHPDTWLSRRS